MAAQAAPSGSAPTPTSCCRRMWAPVCAAVARFFAFLEVCVMCSTTKEYTRTDEAPFQTASLLSRIYFIWASPMIAWASKSGKPIGMDDLWNLRDKETSAVATAKLDKYWAEEVARAKAAGRAPSFATAVWRSVRWTFVQVFILKMGWLLFAAISNSLLLRQMVLFFNSDAPLWQGIVLVIAFLVCELLRSICVNQHWLLAVLTGLQLRSAARTMLYRHALSVRQAGVSVGQMVTMLQADTQRLSEACQYGEFLISTPVTLVVTLGIIWGQLGPSALAGFAVLLIATPIQARIGQWVGSVRRGAVVITDERSKVMNEVLTGIKLLKLYAWEAAFADKVAGIRAREVDTLRKAAHVRALNTVVAFSVPVLVTLTTFLTYTFWTNQPLQPANAFVTIAIFNVARFPLGIVPLSTKQLSEALVGAARIGAFLQEPAVSQADVPVQLDAAAAAVAAAAAGVAVASAASSSSSGGTAAANPNASSTDVAAGEATSALLQQLAGPGTATPAPTVAVAALGGATFVWTQRSPTAAPGGKGGKPGAAAGGKPAAASGSGAPPAAAAAAAAATSPVQLELTVASPSVSSPATASTPVAGSAAFALSASSSSSATAATTDGGDVFAGVRDMDFTVSTGELIGIVGPVGSGKSSLLSALVGQLTRKRGTFAVRGRIAYAPQAPWVFAGSVRDNITFGSAFDAERYAAVVRACALETDFASFPAGDATELGANGVNASGGQKARIQLARAMYSAADIVLLDDPLSAVDVHVGRHLWRHALVGALKAAGKTVLLVTHQLQYLPDCDRIFVMEGGRIVHTGTYPQLVAAGVDVQHLGAISGDTEEVAGAAAIVDDVVGAASPPAAAVASSAAPAVSAAAGDNAAASAAVDTGAKAPPTVTAPLVQATAPTVEGPLKVVLVAEAPAAAPSDGAATAPSAAAPSGGARAAGKSGAAAGGGALIAAEDRAAGAVSLRTVAAYFNAAGGCWVLAYLCGILLLSKGSLLASQWWLGYWTNKAATGQLDDSTQKLYLGVYAAIVGGVFLFTAIQGFSFAGFTLKASRRLHDRVFASVLRATSSWLDTQPTGRILARFTGDLDTVDSQLPANLEQALEYQFQVYLSIVLICIVFPWFLIPLVPIAAMFVFVTKFFRRAARDLKRLDNISRSPLVSHIQATMTGLVSVRTYGRVQQFNDTNTRLVDNTTRSSWAFYAANRWVAIRLDIQTTLVAVAVAALCVVGKVTGTIPPSFAALAIVQALQTTGLFQFSVRLLTETEAQFTSIERLNYYTHQIPHEQVTSSDGAGAPRQVTVVTAATSAAAAASNTTAVVRSIANNPCGFPAWYPAAWDSHLKQAAWPSRGEVAFNNVSVRYREGLPLVLQGVTFRIQPSFKVAVVGRTGSGKTTMTQALFRMMECASGSITIDGVDIASVNVYQLRSSLDIIPQDPVIYAGTLRYNLDVFSEFSDDVVMSAAIKAGLGEFVSRHPLKLGRLISATTLSQGECQLVALARACLRNSKILVLDEASASVDLATDAAIQATLRQMVDKTMVIIAHRLHTVMDCDRVLVLDHGRVAAFDHPAALLGLAPPREPPAVLATAADGAATPVTGNIFASLVEETGPETSAVLKAMAARAAEAVAR